MRPFQRIQFRRLILAVAIFATASIVAGMRQWKRVPLMHGQIASDELVELSGLVRADAAGEFWGHNDSGHPPVIFRFNDRGQVRQRVVVSGAANIDWEAMTTDDRGRLLIADVGDNARRRGQYTIYQIAEPRADADEVTVQATYRFTYPDGRSRDCEAIFSMNRDVYIITKEMSPQASPTVYRLDGFNGDTDRYGLRKDDGNPTVDAPSTERKLRVTKVGSLGLDEPLTDASWSSELKLLAVLTYGGVYLHRVESEAQLLDPPVRHIDGFFGQCEALCFDGQDVIVTNEPGMIWRFPTADEAP